MNNTTELNLTDRETGILKLLANGYEKDEIANILFLSPHTIKAQISMILRKLNVKNKTQAVYNAYKFNFIS